MRRPFTEVPRRAGCAGPAIVSTVLLAACLPDGSGTDATPEGPPLSTGDVVQTLRMHGMSFAWRGDVVREDILCARTRFPAFRGGGGDPFSGATYGLGRGPLHGWAPLPAWRRIDVGGDRFLVRLACEGMAEGLKPLGSDNVASAVAAFAIIDENGATGLRPEPGVEVEVGEATAPPSLEAAGHAARTAVRELLPFAGTLRGYPRASLAEPSLVSLGQRLPDDGDRRHESRPWTVTCSGGLPPLAAPAPNTPPDKPVPGTSSARAFALQPSDALALSGVWSGCMVTARPDRGVSGTERARSPYPQGRRDGAGTVHMLVAGEASGSGSSGQSGREAFAQARRLVLDAPHIVANAHHRRAYRPALDRDSFLDGDFFQTYLADSVEDYDARALPDWLIRRDEEFDRQRATRDAEELQ